MYVVTYFSEGLNFEPFLFADSKSAKEFMEDVALLISFEQNMEARKIHKGFIVGDLEEGGVLLQMFDGVKPQ